MRSQQLIKISVFFWGWKLQLNEIKTFLLVFFFSMFAGIKFHQITQMTIKTKLQHFQVNNSMCPPSYSAHFWSLVLKATSDRSMAEGFSDKLAWFPLSIVLIVICVIWWTYFLLNHKKKWKKVSVLFNYKQFSPQKKTEILISCCDHIF